MTKTFPMPEKAGHHCRHYDYVLGLEGGPTCAIGIDLTKPGSSRVCMPLKAAEEIRCKGREDYTEAERGAWREATHARTFRTFSAIGALPTPIPLDSTGSVNCPNCDGGTLTYSRWERGASICCSTENCCSATMSIAAGIDWPPVEPERGERNAKS